MPTWKGIFSFLLKELWTYCTSSMLTTSCRSFYYQLSISSTSVHNDLSDYLFPCRQYCTICIREWEFSNITCRHSYCSCSRSSWRRKTTRYRGCWWAPSPFPVCLLWVFSKQLPSYHSSEMKKRKRKEKTQPTSQAICSWLSMCGSQLLVPTKSLG